MKKMKNIPRADREVSDPRVQILGCICAILVIISIISLIFADGNLKSDIQSTEEQESKIGSSVKHDLSQISKKLTLAAKCYSPTTYRRVLTDVLLLSERIDCTLGFSKSGELTILREYCSLLADFVYSLCNDPSERSRGVCLELEAVNSSLIGSELTRESIARHVSMLSELSPSESEQAFGQLAAVMRDRVSARIGHILLGTVSPRDPDALHTRVDTR